MESARRVLLVNPPIVDLRVPWSEWVEPTGLLKVGSFLRRQGSDVKLLDCFGVARKQRQRQRIIERESQTLYVWRFGLRASEIRARLRALRRDGWLPDAVMITTLASFWWEGAAFVISLVREVFPDAGVVVGGQYGREVFAHAPLELSGVDLDRGDGESGAGTEVPALDLYDRTVGVVPVTNLSDVGLQGICDTIGQGTSVGATRIHLADHSIASSDPELLKGLLLHLADNCPRTRLFVLGAVSAQELGAWPELAGLLRRARCRQLVLADNRDYPTGSDGHDQFLEDVDRATRSAREAGFDVGTEDFGVEVSVGRPDERPEDTAELVARLAHIAGSVVAVPYQPSLSEVGSEDPWETNCKLFPLAERNGSTFMAHMELLGICAMANAKYRSRTFDFLSGDSLIARSLRRSLASGSWDPHRLGRVVSIPLAERSGEDVA